MTTIIKGDKHVTASVWILTKASPKKVLLIHHKKFDKWIQPGGHVEKLENPLECAVREIKEETVWIIGFLKEKIKILKDGDKFLPIPDFFMEQSIPAHGKEPSHFHIDINCVVAIGEQDLKHNPSESQGIGWFTKKEALKLQIHENTRIILNKFLFIDL